MRTVSIPAYRLPRYIRLLLVTAACLAVTAAPVAGGDQVYLELEADGIEDLGSGWAYEGWLIVDGAPVSTGVFTVSDDGEPSRRHFAVTVDDGAAVGAFVLTIEPVPDMDSAPSAVHLLGGDFSGSMADLTAGHPAALGDDFSSAAGMYILNAPSGGEGADYRNGIWWLDPDAGPGPSLSLPDLPEGWAYEGWVVGPGGPMTTGRFTDVAGDDSDAGGITAGPFETPPFPGQDLLNPPTDLTSGYAAVVSIEPEPDNSPAPFTLKPLVDGDIDDVGAGVLQSMMNNAAAFPTGSLTMRMSEVTTETAHLRLDLTGLDDLGPDFAYEGWLIVDGAAVSTGVFTVAGGVPSQAYFPTEVDSLDAITTFVLTIEPVPDPDPAPSPVHLLGGDFGSPRAWLSVAHPAALGTDFETIEGPYILNAPSAGATRDYRNGIWWLDPEAGPGPTLVLPDLPDGWVYEGWVVGSEGPVTTGRFSSASGADSDGKGPDAGPEDAPPFPGQDYVDPSRDLTSGYAAVISVEPEPDNSPGPFTLKPLLDPSIDDVGEGVLQPMARNPASLPTGWAVLLEPVTIPGGGHTPGFAGSMWRSNLELRNGDTMHRRVIIQLLEADRANPDPEWTMVMLAPGSAVRYEDAFDAFFDYTGTGALRILRDSYGVQATTRTFNELPDGSPGQGIGPHLTADALTWGRPGTLIGLSESPSLDSGCRTNIGLVNDTGFEVVVHVDLYRGDASYIGTVTATLEAFEQTQLNRVFPEAVDVGSAVVWTSTPGGRFFAWASKVDNPSGDPTFIAAQ
jgi:hypothetical protein